MPEKTIRLTGWSALAVIVVVVGLFGYRVLTLRNLEDNDKLVQEVKILLQTEYLPDDVRNMESLYESGKTEELGKAVESLATTIINIESITAGIPPFNLKSERRKVVTKVVYSITDVNGVRQEGTKYYRFDYAPMVNSWQWGREVTAISYYLNLF
jgi:hypothetical protein